MEDVGDLNCLKQSMATCLSTTPAPTQTLLQYLACWPMLWLGSYKARLSWVRLPSLKAQSHKQYLVLRGLKYIHNFGPAMDFSIAISRICKSYPKGPVRVLVWNTGSKAIHGMLSLDPHSIVALYLDPLKYEESARNNVLLL